MRLNARVSLALVSTIFATAALADEIPPRKPGGWEVVMKGEKIPSVTMKLCIDKDTDQLFHKMGTEIAEKCSHKDVKVADNVVTVDSQCKIGSSTETGTMVMKFTGDTAYHADIKSHFEPALMGKTDAEMTQDAKWTGPCPPDMKPGDFTAANGIKLNIKMLDTLRKFLPSK